ncbi:MAG: DNA repair protein RecO [Firmicutes bacterium]|nr:DNA repair protein RecO [Bacillota bacterium]
MYTDSEGIILRQIKAAGGRRMILLFSRKYGKISAGSSISEKGRSKAALAMRPFTFGRYELFKNRDSYNINSGEVIKSFYRIGEDVDKYMCASYVLEYTDKILADEQPMPRMLDLLIEFFDLLSVRQKRYETLVSAYQIKALALLGNAPELGSCVICGSKEELSAFSVKDGGAVCESCRKKMQADSNVSLIFNANFGTIGILKYFLNNSLKSLERIGLEEDAQALVRNILKSYGEYHLDIAALKSESFFNNQK